MPESFKNLPRLYTRQDLGQEVDITLEADHVHYLRNVLRKSVDDELRFFNGHDGEWLYKIKGIDKKRGVCVPSRPLRHQTKSDAPLILFFAPVKKTQTDFIVQKATELGVSEICPIVTDHSNAQNVRTDRWITIATEAAEQSERLTVPGIANLTDLKTATKNFPANGRLLVGMERLGDGECEMPEISLDQSLGLIIGPEGGFSKDEIDFFNQNERFHPVSFGQNILRAETAVITGLAILQYLRCRT